MTDRKVPPLYRELARLGELPPQVSPELRAALEATEAGEVAPTDAEVLARVPPEVFAAAVQRRTQRQRRRRAAVAGGLLAAALGLFVLVPRTPPPGADAEVRIKGERVRLEAWVERDAGARALVEGDVLREGDRVQLVVHGGGEGAGVVWSVDGRGVVTEHHRFVDAAQLRLPSSYRLDDAPDFEVFLVAVGSLDPDEVLQRAREHGGDPAALPLGEGVQLRSLRVTKGDR